MKLLNGTTIRTFLLQRKEDVSGVSGCGVVAVGAIFPSGRVIIEWRTAIQSVEFFRNLKEALRIHGHDGKTIVRWRRKPKTVRSKRKKL